MLNFALSAIFIFCIAVETQSWSVTALAIVVAVYACIQNRMNAELYAATKELNELSQSIVDSQKASIATQRAYANHVSDLRQMVLSMNGVKSDMNVKRHVQTVSPMPGKSLYDTSIDYDEENGPEAFGFKQEAKKHEDECKRKLEEMKQKPILSQRPNWVPEDDYQG